MEVLLSTNHTYPIKPAGLSQGPPFSLRRKQVHSTCPHLGQVHPWGSHPGYLASHHLEGINRWQVTRNGQAAGDGEMTKADKPNIGLTSVTLGALVTNVIAFFCLTSACWHPPPSLVPT